MAGGRASRPPSSKADPRRVTIKARRVETGRAASASANGLAIQVGSPSAPQVGHERVRHAWEGLDDCGRPATKAMIKPANKIQKNRIPRFPASILATS